MAQFLIPGSAIPVSGHSHPALNTVRAAAVGVVGDYPQILARPLFTPTRNPSDSGLAPVGAQLSDYSVVGTAVARGAGTAVVRDSTGQMRSLRVGDTLLGWRLAAIRPDGIVLEGAGGQRMVPVTGGAAAPIPSR